MHGFYATMWHRCRGISLLAGSLVITAVSWQTPACAQSGTWNAAAGTTAAWSGTSNWQGGVVASGAGNTATFSNNAGTSTTTLDSNRTVGAIAVVTTGTRVIGGSGSTLTLAS